MTNLAGIKVLDEGMTFFPIQTIAIQSNWLYRFWTKNRYTNNETTVADPG